MTRVIPIELSVTRNICTKFLTEDLCWVRCPCNCLHKWEPYHSKDWQPDSKFWLTEFPLEEDKLTPLCALDSSPPEETTGNQVLAIGHDLGSCGIITTLLHSLYGHRPELFHFSRNEKKRNGIVLCRHSQLYSIYCLMVKADKLEWKLSIGA